MQSLFPRAKKTDKTPRMRRLSSLLWAHMSEDTFLTLRFLFRDEDLTLVMLNKLQMYMPCPLLTFSQSDCLIRILAINSHT